MPIRASIGFLAFCNGHTHFSRVMLAMISSTTAYPRASLLAKWWYIAPFVTPAACRMVSKSVPRKPDLYIPWKAACNKRSLVRCGLRVVTPALRFIGPLTYRPVCTSASASSRETSDEKITNRKVTRPFVKALLPAHLGSSPQLRVPLLRGSLAPLRQPTIPRLATPWEPPHLCGGAALQRCGK